jgi:autotransporter-associated beta strand protein
MKPKGHSRLFATSAILIVATFATASSFAASATWNGTTNATWATDTNWSATPAPGAADTATFNNAGNGNTTIDLGAGISVGNIAFDAATAASYVIGSGGAGSQGLTLSASGSITMAASVINNQSINANLSLGTAAVAEAFTITNNKAAASNTLTFAGGVSTLLSGVKTLTVAGTGVTNINGAINDGSGTLALNKTGPNVLTLSGASNYSGGTLVTGILAAANSSALGTGPVTINAATGNQLQLANGVNIANPLTLSGGGVVAQGVVYLPAGNATYSGTINASTQNSGGHLATAGYIDNTLTIAGDNTITSAVPLTIRNGTIKITGSQNHTGGTSMNGAAFIQFGKTTSMPSTGSVVTIANGVIAVNAGGAGEFTGGTGAGTIGGLTSGIGGQGAPVTWVANTTLAIDTTNATGTVTHSGAFTPAVAVGLTKLGPGTLELTGGGTYASSANIVGTMPLIVRQGTLLLNGGTHAVNGEIGIGTTFGTAAGAAGYNAKLQVDSGALSTTSWLSVGKGNGIGVVSSDLEVNNGATVTALNFSGGWNNNAATNLPKGSVTLNNTSSLSVSNNVHIAESPGSNFTLNVNGTSTFSQTANANQTTVGMSANAVGIINVNGGTASFHRDLIIGGNAAGASGRLNINSGTVNAATTVERWLLINTGNTSSGRIDVNGGTLNLNTNTDLRFSTNAASAGTNIVNLTAGAITGHTGNNNGIFSATSLVDMNNASNAAVNNTFNLDGGTLTIGQVISSNNGGTAAFNFNGGTLRAAANSANFVDLGGVTQSANVQAGGAVIDSNGNTVTIVEGLKAGTGSGGLTKLGAGNLRLAGTNTYIGTTLVSAGTLTLADLGEVNTSSGITVNGSGAKLVQSNFLTISTPITLTQGSIDGNGTVSSLTVANNVANTLDAGAGGNATLIAQNLTFQGAATVNITATGSNTVRGFEAGNLTTNAAGKVVVNATNTNGAWLAGDYPVILYTSSFTGAASDFLLGAVAGLAVQQDASIVNVPGYGIVLRIEGDSLTWTGNQNGNWSTTPVGGASNWWYPSESQNTEFSNNNPVLFNDNATLFDVVLTSNVSPSTTVFDNFTNNYTLSSPGGFGILTGSLVKNGDAMVTITTTNSFTGSTTLNGGTLQIGNGSTDGSIATSGIITANAGNLIFNLVGSHTYANPIAGTTNALITKKGTGSLTLSGNNTFAGDLVLENGVLNLNSPNALGTAPGFLTIQGGTLDNTSGAAVTSTSNKLQKWDADFTFTGTHDLFLGTGGVTLGGSGTVRTVTVSAGTLGTGPVGSLGYDLVKSGAGALRLSGGNSVINGTVQIQAGIIGSTEDFFANGLTGTGTFENGGAANKWSFWTIASDQTSDVLIRNGGGTGLLGIVKRGSATWTLTNNANNATANLAVDSGRLILNNTGTYGAGNPAGATATTLTAIIGNNALDNGVLDINGATVNYNNASAATAEPWRSTLSVGNNGTGAGALNLTSGSLTTNRQLAVGSVAGAYGSYNQSGGTTSIGGFLALGLGTASASFTQSAGVFTNAVAPVTNGAGAGSNGVMNLSGSAVYNQNGTGDNGIWVGESGSGTLNISGSAALNMAATNNGIQLGRNASGVGTVNLNGGNVTTLSIYKGAGTGTLSFNGGSLTAAAANANFLTGLTSAYVRSGGGTINNGGNAITIGQALLAPAGNGVSATGLNASGTGFIGAPLVQIAGDGTGATAVANVTAGGILTGVTITNPGTGYTSAPTFTLLGGGIGSTGGFDGSASLVANTSGGMTFSGAGVTTLSGVNTYAGNTTVATGSTLALADNAALRFIPGANNVSNKLTGAGTAFLYGDFNIELAGAAIANGNTWTLVDVTSKTYDPFLFNVPGFTQAADVWTFVDGNNTWTFTEATGVLSLQVTGLSGYAGWAAANANGEAPDGDFDKDGVRNGVEYFMGATGSGFTANPSIVAGKITWPKDPAFVGTYTVQTSPNLTTWTNVASTVVGNTVEYTPATGQGKVFIRLVVTPN